MNPNKIVEIVSSKLKSSPDIYTNKFAESYWIVSNYNYIINNNLAAEFYKINLDILE